MEDLSPAGIAALMKEAKAMKAARRPSGRLKGKTLGMIFQKPSTRTAVSFSVAMFELGGMSLPMNAQDLQTKRGESWADTARTLSRYVSVIMIRANSHADVLELARYSGVPIINGLTDKEHPCQVLADLFTLMEVFRAPTPAALKDKRILYIGDGNNMTHSWMILAALVGLDLVVCTPSGYAPERAFVEKAARLGGRIRYEGDPQKAAQGASVIYTDVWASMGKEAEHEHRKNVFQPYQVNDALLSRARPDAVVMHCLPAHRGEEITESVIDGPRSVVFQQAENRLHVQKAILLRLVK